MVPNSDSSITFVKKQSQTSHWSDKKVSYVNLVDYFPRFLSRKMAKNS